MDSSETTTGKTDKCPVDAAAPDNGCPVDHGGSPRNSSAATEQPAPSTAVPATSLPVSRMPMTLQLLLLFQRPGLFVTRCRRLYGSRVRVKFRPGPPVFLLSDPEDIKAIFLAPRDVLHTGRSNQPIEKFTGQSGLAWLDEDEHKARRKLLMRSFKGDALERIGESVRTMAEDHVATWPRNKPAALHPYVHRFTMEVIREVIFGRVVPSRWNEMSKVLLECLNYNQRTASVIMIHRLSPRTLRILRAIRPLGLDKFLKDRERAEALIAEAVEERMNRGDLGDDMLSVLLGITHDDGSPLSAKEFRDEMMTVFLAGTETTAAAVCWALEHLSRSPADLARLVAEIEEGSDDTFLTAVVHEVLRLRPPTPQIVPREVVKPIEIGGVRYEPGTLLWASGYLLNRDPVRYPEPDEFRPERFVNVKPGAHTWIPFGGGHTRCLGDRIAITEMKAVLRAVLSTYELSAADTKSARPRSRTVVIIPDQAARLMLRPKRKMPVGSSS
ncbi:cytochrome P450 [Nocardia sp. BMG51109]|uniref:cytochrome P450 n=1 Tax=Nocardia sp. BMG51109 TaxID=1056816 RepID=UPI00046388CF|nr:cytochrome P450 [Nocardia sp. BMG51109]